MAKVASFPSLDIIAGFKGVLDFYTYKDTKCVRQWPVITGHHTTIRESANQARFRYFQKSLRALNPRVKQLWRGTAALANWRYHENAYRWYMGKGLGNILDVFPTTYPRYKEWPPDPNKMWFMHRANWLFKEPWLWLVFWLDRPVEATTLIWDDKPPDGKEVIRIERGVSKSCGIEPDHWRTPSYHAMDSGFWGEWPVVTHFLPWPILGGSYPGGLWMQLVCARGADAGYSNWQDTVFGYSTGPVFYFRSIHIPGYCRNGQWWSSGLSPMNPGFDTHEQKVWRRHEKVYRSWRWPYVRLPDDSDIELNIPFPLEQFPAPPPGPA